MNDNAALWDFPHGQRELFISQNKFYLDEAKKRVLGQFTDIEAEADKHRDDELNRMSSNFNPDYHDVSSFYEAAEGEGYSMWESLHELRNSMVLAIASGMFHNFEKTIRQKLEDELNHVMERGKVKKLVWKDVRNFDQLIELLADVQPGIEAQPFISELQLLRLIVNVYKHGDGGSHEKLSKQHPEFYSGSHIAKKFSLDINHEELVLPDEYLDKFAGAIEGLWRFLPDRVSIGEFNSRGS